MQEKEKCKVKKCNHVAKKSGFCGWCYRKFSKGILRMDGKEVAYFCKSCECERPAKKQGWCGICKRKFDKGLLMPDGSLPTSVILARKQKSKRMEKRAKNKKARELVVLKDNIRGQLSRSKLTELKVIHPEYDDVFGCPNLMIFIDTTSCFIRMFLSDRPKKKCKKCTYHDDKLEQLVVRLTKTEKVG